MELYLLTIIIAAGILCVVVPVWFLLRKRAKTAPSVLSDAPGRLNTLDLLIVLLCFIGIFLMPMHVRMPILNQLLPKPLKQLDSINYPCVLAILLSLFRLRRWSWVELLCFPLWLLLSIPMFYSNRELKDPLAITAAAMTLLPLFLVLYPMDPASRRKCTGLFVILFDVFIAVLLICGLVDRGGSHPLMSWVAEQLEAAGFKADELGRYLRDPRFGFVWGHTLTNAVYFNAFLVINVIWLRSNGRRCPVLLFFFPALIGVLLTSSKTGVTVCFLLLFIMMWKNKKWLLACIPVLVLLHYLGAFDRVIFRFTHFSLTTGRWEVLKDYFTSGINPFHFLYGYNSSSVLKSTSDVFSYKVGFEFPAILFSYYYGIFFTIIHMGGLFVYISWRFLQKKNWFPWLCWSLLFAEINTYNAYALRNQDVCVFFCFFTMIMLNMEWPEAQTTKGKNRGITDHVIIRRKS